LKEREADGVKTNDPIWKGTYDGMRMFLSRLGKKVLNKKVYPHLFRHSSATYYASRLNRQELCYRYGWKFSSDMPDVYISRAGMESKELDEKFKATELEYLEKKFEKERFDKDKKIDNLKKLSDIQTELNELVIKKISGQELSEEESQKLVKLANEITQWKKNLKK